MSEQDGVCQRMVCVRGWRVSEHNGPQHLRHTRYIRLTRSRLKLEFRPGLGLRIWKRIVVLGKVTVTIMVTGMVTGTVSHRYSHNYGHSYSHSYGHSHSYSYI